MKRAALVFLVVAACRPGRDPVVARVDGAEIRLSALQRRTDGSRERSRDELERMIRDELLVQEAMRRGLDRSPAVRNEVRRALVQELLRSEAEAEPAISGAEVRSWYDAHAAEFQQPERVRVLHALLPASGPRAREQAKLLLEEIDRRERRGERSAFQSVAMQKSADPATRAAGGDLGLRSRTELAAAVGAEAASAAFALRKAGEKAGPFETSRGFEIVELAMRVEAVSRSFESVAEQIRGRLLQERRNARVARLVEGLRKRSAVRVDEAALSAAADPGAARP